MRGGVPVSEAERNAFLNPERHLPGGGILIFLSNLRFAANESIFAIRIYSHIFEHSFVHMFNLNEPIGHVVTGPVSKFVVSVRKKPSG